jgi:hypothetical protein
VKLKLNPVSIERREHAVQGLKLRIFGLKRLPGLFQKQGTALDIGRSVKKVGHAQDVPVVKGDPMADALQETSSGKFIHSVSEKTVVSGLARQAKAGCGGVKEAAAALGGHAVQVRSAGGLQGGSMSQGRIGTIPETVEQHQDDLHEGALWPVLR